MTRTQLATLILILLLAAALRFYGLDWDGGLGAHPDERYVVGAAESVRWPDQLNPFDVAPGYAYGHLPLYLLALVGGLAQGTDWLLVGRALAALFDLGTVALTFALGRRVYGKKVGLLAAAFVALMVSHVQQAHFYTADAPLAFFVLGALLFAVRLAERGRARDAWLAGAWAGLALGTKFNVALLALPLAVAYVVGANPRGRPFGQARGLPLQCGAAAIVAFALTNPFALVALPAFWRNVTEQAAVARGLLDAPYTRQFHGTWPYVYPVVQQLRWGMGWALGLVACGGLAYGVWRAVREPPRRAEWVLLAWAL
ncbi:MAG: glycosyltransferase family 39 protein, partial [Chloroflexota bacterium]|nr:glycosyltransferase family 39 protein [Chloroflexota bacterium]